MVRVGKKKRKKYGRANSSACGGNTKHVILPYSAAKKVEVPVYRGQDPSTMGNDGKSEKQMVCIL